MFGDAKEKKKILLIDDDDIHLMTAELFLKDEYEVIKTKSGNEALEYLNGGESVPNLILLDIVMPDMDGWGVLKKIKTIEKLKNTPVAFLTSIVSDAEKQRALKMGIADFITKPFNMTILKNRISNVLAKQQKPAERHL